MAASSAGGESSGISVKLLKQLELPSNITSIVYSEAGNVLIACLSSGELLQIDADLPDEQAIVQRICPNRLWDHADTTSGDSGGISTVSLYYEKATGMLFMADAEAVSLRKDYQQVHFLRTAFDRRLDFEDDTHTVDTTTKEEEKQTETTSTGVNENAHVSIEITNGEAVKLRDYLSSVLAQPKKLLDGTDCDIVKNVVDGLQKELEIGCPTRSVVLSGGWAQLMRLTNRTLLNATPTVASSTQSSSSHVSLLAAIAERLLLKRSRPYSFEPVDSLMVGCETAGGFDKTVMAHEAARRLTFQHWPHMHYRWALPNQMAEAGFYHQPNELGDDRVMCFTCNVCLICWEPSDEPWSEHERHSPQCPFVRGEVTQNVSVGVTLSALPAVEHRMRSQPRVIATVSHCNWLAVGGEGATVQLWRLDSVKQEPQNFTIDLSDPFVGLKTGYINERKRPQRVTWSDDACEPHAVAVTCEEGGDQSVDSNADNSKEATLCSGDVLSPGDVVVSALCCANKPLNNHIKYDTSQWQATVEYSAGMIAAVRVNDAKLKPTTSATATGPLLDDSSNTVDVATESPQRQLSDTMPSLYRPFLLVYTIDESPLDENGDHTQCNADDGRVGAKRPASSAFKPTSTANHFYGGIDPNSEIIGDDSDDSAADLEPDLMTFEADGGGWGIDDFDAFSSSVGVPAALPPPSLPPLSADAIQMLTQQQQFLPMASANKENNNETPTGDEANGDNPLRISYTPTKLSLLVVQCFRLPATYDSCDAQVLKMLASNDGLSLIVVCNKKSDDGDVRSGGLLVYRYTFAALMTGVQEQPVKEVQCGGGVCITDAVLLPDSALSTDGTIHTSSDAGCAAVCFDNGTVSIVNLAAGNIVATLADHQITRLTLAEGKRLCGISSGNKIKLFDVEVLSVQSDDTFDSYLKLFLKNPSEVADKLSASDDLAVKGLLSLSEPLTKESLWTMWALSRGDDATTAAAVTFNVSAPSCWYEVQQHQRFRRNPQYYLRDQIKSRTWHLSPASGSWREHIFNIVLPVGIQACHIDVKFLLHPNNGCPDVQVALLCRTLNDSGRSERTPPTAEEGRRPTLSDWRVIAGPLRFSDSLDLTEAGGILQLFSPVLQSNRYRHFCLHFKTLSEESEHQKLWKAASEEIKAENADFVAKAKKAQQAYAAGGTSYKRKDGEAVLFQDCYTATAGGGIVRGSARTRSEAAKQAQGNIDRKGCDCIDELSITVWKQKKSAIIPNEKLERLALVTSRKLHENLVDTLWGKVPSLCDSEASLEYSQSLALDIICSLLDQWSFHSSLEFFVRLSEMFAKNMDKIVLRCFVDASRSIAHKCTAIFAEICRCLPSISVEVYEKFTDSLCDALCMSMPLLGRARSSGGLVWLFSIVSRLFRSDARASKRLMSCLFSVLREVGHELTQRSSAPHRCLSSRYKLYGMPFEKELFEWPSTVLSMYQKALNPATYASAVQAGAVGLTGGPATVFVGNEIAENEMDWTELLHVETADSTVASFSGVTSSLPMLSSANTMSTFGGGAAAAAVVSGAKTLKKRVLLSKEHIYGLIENEPLNYKCQSASEGIKVENLDTGVVTGSGQWSSNGSAGIGPISLPYVNQHTGGFGGGPGSGGPGGASSNPAFAHYVSTMNQQVQSILSKQMQVLALQQQQSNKQQANSEQKPAAGVVQPTAVPQSTIVHPPGGDSTLLPGTQGSSASTFGVPTTPKTTPFMTPTPLSPYQLSPINSESNLSSHFTTAATTTANDEISVSLLNQMPEELLRLPSPHALVIDRMNSGARKFVVLDFGKPVLLTDVLLPASGEVGSVTVDVWLHAEAVDGRRLLVSADISNKTVVVSDLQPAVLCRYLKITYIGRQGLPSCVCRVPLGVFHGYRYLSSWQLALCGGEGYRDDLIGMPAPFASLQQQEENLRCRFSLAVRRLKAMLDGSDSMLGSDLDVGGAPPSAPAVRDAYRECAQIRLQWNILRRILNRFQAHQRPVVAVDHRVKWNKCSYDHLRCLSDLILCSAVRNCPFVNMTALSADVDGGLTALLTQPLAVELFKRFVALHSQPRLQVLCSSLLLIQGCSANWWGSFFVTVLRDLYAHFHEDNNKLFILLSFLCNQSIRAKNTDVIVELLKFIEHIISGDQVTPSSNSHLLTWALLLVSSCFDVASGGRRWDRWSFLSAEYGSGASTLGNGSSSGGDKDQLGRNTRRRLTRRPAGKVKFLEQQQGMELLEQYYQKSVQLTEEEKKMVANVTSSPQGAVASTSTAASQKYNDGRPLASLPSSKKRRSSLSNTTRNRSHGSSSRSSSSTHLLRLKLPSKQCLAVGRALFSLLVGRKSVLNSTSQLVLCKVLAKVSVNVAGGPIPLLSLTGSDGVRSLFLLATDTAQSPLLRHAVRCLVMDVLDAEVKKSSKSAWLSAAAAGATSAAAVSLSALLDGRSATMAIGCEAVLSTPDTPGDAQQIVDSAVSKILPLDAPSCQIDIETRTKQLRIMCREMIHSYLNSGQPFSLINQWIEYGKTCEKNMAITGKNVQKYTALMSIQSKMKQHHFYSTSAFDTVFPSINSANVSSATSAAVSSLLASASATAAGVNSAAPLINISMPSTSDVTSMLSSAIYSSMNAAAPLTTTIGSQPAFQPILFSMPPSANATSVGGTPPFPLVFAASSLPKLPAVSVASSSDKSVAGNYAANKEKLSKLCETLQMSTNISPYMSPYLPVTTGDGGNMVDSPSKGSMKRSAPDDVDSPPSSTKADTAMGGCGDDGSISGESQEEASSVGDINDSRSSSVTDLNTVARSTVQKALLSKEAKMDINIRAHMESVQPVSLCLDERMDSQPAWRSLTECQRWLFTDDTLLRITLSNLTPSNNAASRSIGSGSSKDAIVTSVPSVSVVGEQIRHLFVGVSSFSPERVQLLLGFYFELLLQISKRSGEERGRPIHPTDGSISPITALRLDKGCADQLIQYFTIQTTITDYMWTTLWRIFDFSIQLVGDGDNLQSLGAGLVSADNFWRMLLKFMKKSGGVSSNSSSVDPELIRTFGDFICRLCSNSNKDGRVWIGLTSVFVESLETGEISAMSARTRELLIRLLEVVRWPPFDIDVGADEASTVASMQLLQSVCRFARRRLVECDSAPCRLLLSGNHTAAHPTLVNQSSPFDANNVDGSKSHADRLELLSVSLLNEAAKMCRQQSGRRCDADEPLADLLARDEAVCSAVVGDLLHALSVCHFGDDGAPETTDFQPVSMGDWALRALLDLTKATAELDSFFKVVVRLLDEITTTSDDDIGFVSLSEPIVWYLTTVLKDQDKVSAFACNGGLRLTCSKLLASIGGDEDIDGGSIRHCSLRELASVSTQVMGYTNTSVTPVKKPPDSKIDQMINYAPIGQITSSSPMAHHLTALLPSTPPHRRARTAAWSYHFYPAEMWLDLTVTLPYPITLKEVQIRPHTPTLNTGPGAVHVELGPDINPCNLKALGPPISTAGCSKIRISVMCHRQPVQLVKLHIKRPPDSSNLGLTQILLLGGPAYAESFDDYSLNMGSFNWLPLLDHLMSSEGLTNLWEYQPPLTAALVRLLLTNRSLSDATRNQLSNVLERLDGVAARSEEAIGSNVLGILLRHLCRSELAVVPKALLLVSDLIYRLCVADNGVGATRRAQLLDWIHSLLSDHDNVGKPHSPSHDVVIPTVIWVAACIEWWRVTAASKHPVRKTLISTLCDCVKRTDERASPKLKRAAATLLCSISAQNEDNCRLMIDQLFCVDDPVLLKYFAVAAQNELVVMQLLQADSEQRISRFDLIIKQLTDPSLSGDAFVCMLGLLTKLCFVGLACERLAALGAESLLMPLLRLVVRLPYSASETFNQPLCVSYGDDEDDMVATFIGLLQRCLTHSSTFRETYGRCMCQLLEERPSTTGKGLGNAMQQMLLFTLLQDEQLQVLLNEPRDIASIGRLTHPCFGCQKDYRVVSKSVYTECCKVVKKALPSPPSGNSSSSVAAAFKQQQQATAWASALGWGSSAAANGQLALMPKMPKSYALPPLSMAAAGTSGSTVRESGQMATQELKSDTIYADMNNSTTPVSVPVSAAATTLADMYAALKANGCQDGPSFLRIRASKSADEKSMPVRPSSEADFGKPTLTIFAEQGGLAFLAQYLQLYQPVYTVTSRRTTAMANGGATDDHTTAAGDLSFADSSITNPYGYPSSALSMPYAPDYGELTDFEFIDYTPVPGSGWGAQADMGGGGLSMKRMGQGVQSMASSGLPPHVVVCFSIFLRLHGYARLLVSQDRHRAQALLRMALGVWYGSRRPLSESDQLSRLSFSVLERLFATDNWATDAGSQLRQSALTLGVVDILLVCLSQFSHQKPVDSDIGETGATNTVLLVEELLQSYTATDPTDSSPMGAGAIATNTGGGNGGGATAFANSSKPLATAAETRQQYWAKGTGFGTGNTQQQWNVQLHMMKRMQDEENVTCFLKVLSSFICPTSLTVETTRDSELAKLELIDPDIIPAGFVDMLKRSCLVATVSSYLRNDSVLDISRHVSVYESVLRLVAAAALVAPLRPLLLECDASGVTVAALLLKLREWVHSYVSKISNELPSAANAATCADTQTTQSCTTTEVSTEQSNASAFAVDDDSEKYATNRPPIPGDDSVCADGANDVGVGEEGLLTIVPLLEKAADLVQSFLGADVARLTADAACQSFGGDDRYISTLRPLQFASPAFFGGKDGRTLMVPYHYESAVQAATSAVGGGGAKRMRRLAQEIVTLTNSLPLSASSSVFVRASEERLDVMKVMITGPADTPYMNGCFEFDVWFPTDYPQSPMHINLETTGGHTVRFNPNLYNDGKVCLSVLNTWHGRPEERWNAETSSFLQVIVSIQSLILVNEPYFNEPGYERSRGTPAGSQASREYDANIRQATVRWGMLEHLRKPPALLRDAVLAHFWLKRAEVTAQVDSWIAETERYLEENKTARNIGQHLASLKRHYQALKEEFRKMKKPVELESAEEASDETNVTKPVAGDIAK